MSRAYGEKTTVAAIAVSDEMRARMAEMFRRTDSPYLLGDDETADISVIDMDVYLADLVRREHEARYPGRPVLLLSMTRFEDEQKAIVHKPLQVDELIAALDALVDVPLDENDDVIELITTADEITLETDDEQSIESEPEIRDDSTIIQLYKLPISRTPVAPSTSDENEPPSVDPVVPKTKDQIVRATPATAEDQNKLDLLQYLFSEDPESVSSSEPISKLTSDDISVDEPSIPSRPAAESPAVKLKTSKKIPDHLLVGRRADVDLSDEKQLSSVFFSAGENLLGCVLRIVDYADKSGSPVRVEGLPKPITYYPAKRYILSGWTDRELLTFAQTTLEKGKVKIQVLVSDMPKSAAAVARLKPVEPFVWKLALWTSMGRLPVGTSLDQIVVQKHWPNLTRLVTPPYAGAMSVLWEKGNFSILDVLDVLSIPQRYVFGYYSGVHALGLVSQIDGAKKKDRFSEFLTETDVPKSTLSSILSTLLKHKD